MNTLIRTAFISLILICLFSLTAIFNMLSGLSDVSGASNTEYTTVTVASGDTLWSIAGEYMPQYEDQREAVYIIKQANDINSDIYAGQEIIVPLDL